MINCSIEAMLDLWIDFWLARAGEHHYGGHVAEIYAYRLEPYNPRLHRKDIFGGVEDALDKVAHYSAVAKNLVDLINEFCRKWDCTAKVDGQEVNRWNEKVGAIGAFGWRCYVEIQPIDKCDNDKCHDHGTTSE